MMLHTPSGSKNIVSIRSKPGDILSIWKPSQQNTIKSFCKYFSFNMFLTYGSFQAVRRHDLCCHTTEETWYGHKKGDTYMIRTQQFLKHKDPWSNNIIALECIKIIRRVLYMGIHQYAQCLFIQMSDTRF